MAGFAADAVGELEAGAARPGRGGVAAEAHRRVARLADAEPLGDRLAARLAQHRRRRGCARRPAVAGSCQSMISSWRTTGPSPSLRPWQVVPPQVATPT